MATANFESISADIKNRKFVPLYFFCGEEAYFIDQLTDLIEVNALSETEKAFNQTITYGKDLNARQIIETCRRLPMMAERQVVIIKEAQVLSLKEEEEQIYLRYLKNPVKSTVLVFAWKHDTPDGRKSFTKEVKKSAVYFESKRLYDNQVPVWIGSWLSKRKFTIESRAAELLVEFTGSDLSNVTNELEKLIINKKAGAEINLEDIENGVGISKEFNVFELSNALGNKNAKKVFQIVNYFVANPKNGPLVVILATLNTFFAKVYLAHHNIKLPDKDLAGLLKVNQYFIKDYKSAARNYSGQKLEQVFYLLEEYDLRLKGVNSTGNTKEGELLKEITFRIMNS